MAPTAKGSLPESQMGAGLPLIGMVRERQALVNAVKRRESSLLLGPGGSGKTTLVQSLLPGYQEKAPIYIPQFETPHDLLVLITRALLRSGHKLVLRKGTTGSDWEKWLSGKTSVDLKGILWRSLEAEPRTLILDGVNRAGQPTYRFLQRLYFAPGMAIIATARDQLHLGELGRLFWDPRKTIHVQPLTDAEALRLFEAAADHFELRRLRLDEFREKVLDAARGNPGEIVEMCRLAAKPQYVAGNYIKFALIRIDALMKHLR
jgi:GTPase SAR1 family protein